MKRIKIQVHGTIPGYAKDQIVTVNADDEGTPLDLHWRRRLRDSEIDGCCEIVKSQPKPKKPSVLKKREGEEKK